MTGLANPTASQVRAQVMGCRACDLRAAATRPVAFHGPTDAELVIIGEAPGRQEDANGQPFIGPAGQLIRGLFDEFYSTRTASKFWMNAACCYPGKAIKTPTRGHLDACDGNFRAQMDLAPGQVTLVVGGVALSKFRDDVTISQAHGRVMVREGRTLFAAYHPAAALRSKDMLAALRADIKELSNVLAWANHEEMLGEECVKCHAPMVNRDDDGLPWCQAHTKQPALL